MIADPSNGGESGETLLEDGDSWPQRITGLPTRSTF